MYKKNLKLLLPLTLSLSVIPIFTQSCFNSHENNSNEDEVISDINKDPISTKIPDATKFEKNKLKSEIKRIEKKLRETIEYSNLVQWNEHYALSTDKKTKTKIWEPGPGEAKIYTDQDDQFQYFNDFLHTNNNISGTPSPYQKDQRSFLFERAYLFYLKAVDEWKGSDMYMEATFEKIQKAIAEAITPPPNPIKIIKIFKTITDWAISPQSQWYKKSKTIFYDLDLRFKNDSKHEKEWDKYNASYKSIMERFGELEGEILSRMFSPVDGNPLPGLDDFFKELEAAVKKILETMIPPMKVDHEDFYQPSIIKS